MPLTDLSGMHPLAVIAFGVTLALIFFVTRTGYLNGQKGGPAGNASSAQVVALAVDTSALNRATLAIESLTSTVTRFAEVVEDNGETMSHMAMEMGRLREELRIQREISRRV